MSEQALLVVRDIMLEFLLTLNFFYWQEAGINGTMLTDVVDLKIPEQLIQASQLWPFRSDIRVHG